GPARDATVVLTPAPACRVRIAEGLPPTQPRAEWMLRVAATSDDAVLRLRSDDAEVLDPARIHPPYLRLEQGETLLRLMPRTRHAFTLYLRNAARREPDWTRLAIDRTELTVADVPPEELALHVDPTEAAELARARR